MLLTLRYWTTSVIGIVCNHLESHVREALLNPVADPEGVSHPSKWKNFTRQELVSLYKVILLNVSIITVTA